MELFIQVENGITVNHPAFKDNIMEVFKTIPSNWEPFVRVPCPDIGVYQVLEFENPVYRKIDNIWTDVWIIRDMTFEEKNLKQQAVKTEWANRPYSENWSAWIFNETTCQYEPPIPRPEPEENKIVFWCGADYNWKETPPYPQDNKNYQFDFFAWEWKEIS